MGRPKGSISKRSATLLAFLRAEGKDPANVLLRGMASKDEAVAVDCAKTLMPYCYPRLNSIDINLEGEINLELGLEPEALDVIAKIISRRKS